MFLKAFLKRSALLITALITLSTLTGRTQNLPAISTTDLHTRFVWLADTAHQQNEPYATMLIPVKLPHCPQQFYMQFDLGAPNTVFYKAKMNTIAQRYPKSVNLVDSTQLNNQQLLINGAVINSSSITLKAFGNAVINWKSKGIYNIIGTIGADLLLHKTIIINYPKADLQIADSIPAELKPKVKLHDLIYAQNSILLPATLMGKRTMLFFDTGSSAFELLLDEANTRKLAVPGGQPAKRAVNSWGRTLTANTFATNDSLSIAGQRLPIKKVTYMDGASDSQLSRMMALGIGGMTGNKLFLNSILIMDLKAKKFDIVPQAN